MPSQNNLLSCTGEWRSLVTRMVWDHETGGSNPLSPIVLVVLSLKINQFK